MNKQKILITASTFPRWKDDKVSNFVYYLAKELNKYYNVYILAPHFKGAKTFEVMDNINVFRFKYAPFAKWEILTYGGGAVNNIKKNPLVNLLIPMYLLSNAFALFVLLVRFRFKIVNVHWILPTGFVAVFFKFIFRFKLVISSHGGDVYGITKNKFWKKLGLGRINKFVLNNSNVIIPVSSSIAETMSLMIKDSSKIVVCPMGIEYSRFYFDYKERDNLNFEKSRLLFLGRISPEKGVTYLIEAAKLLADNNIDFDLSLVGTGPDEEEMKALVEKYNLRNKVKFLGYINNTEVPALLKNYNIFVSTSLREGLPTAYMEAMAAGLVCVVSKTDGITDLITDNNDGMIYPIGDVQMLANKLTEVINNKQLQKNISIQSQNKAKYFDWEIIGKKYNEAFK